jgi:hypothetical protein
MSGDPLGDLDGAARIHVFGDTRCTETVTADSFQDSAGLRPFLNQLQDTPTIQAPMFQSFHDSCQRKEKVDHSDSTLEATGTWAPFTIRINVVQRGYSRYPATNHPQWTGCDDGSARPTQTAWLGVRGPPLGDVGAAAKTCFFFFRWPETWSTNTPRKMTAPMTAKFSELGIPSRLTRFWST